MPYFSSLTMFWVSMSNIHSDKISYMYTLYMEIYLYIPDTHTLWFLRRICLNFFFQLGQSCSCVVQIFSTYFWCAYLGVLFTFSLLWLNPDRNNLREELVAEVSVHHGKGQGRAVHTVESQQERWECHHFLSLPFCLGPSPWDRISYGSSSSSSRPHPMSKLAMKISHLSQLLSE